MAEKRALPTPKELYDNLFACINCVFEDTCTNQLPFPLNLCEHCEKFEKVTKIFD
jgi:hypothetical protein